MSSSSNSKSAPAAFSTLTASGTTSLPAPSHGTTAMCSGRGLLPLAELVALDLARHRLRQLGHELDQMGVLEALQARLAVLLQLGDERVPGDHVTLRDDEGLDAREPVDADPHHRALGDRRVLDERRLDLHRRDPQAADLDHVVRAALVPVVAALVDAIAVAAEEPLAEDRPFRLLVLRPVQREGAVALDVEVAGLAVRHRPAFGVEDLELVA